MARNLADSENGHSLLRIPKNEKKRAIWIRNLRREGSKPSPATKICSDHILEKYIYRDGVRTTLSHDAVPTRFKRFPDHLKPKKTAPRRTIIKKVVSSPCQPIKPPEPLPEPSVAESSGSLSQPPIPSDSPPPPTPSSLLPSGQNNEDTPRTLKRVIQRKNTQLLTVRKRLQISQQRNRRLKKRVITLESLIKELRQKDLISRQCEEMLEKTFSPELKAVFKRIIKRGGSSGKGMKYSPELKSFALTLQFYSSKAYEFVRQKFNKALPHQSQIQKWYSSIPADPGFTEPAFLVLKEKVRENINKPLLVALMLDEMSIRKLTSWDGEKFRGYVDLGSEVDDDTRPHVKDALVFMVVHIDGSWKVPCAYFLIHSLTGVERANLVKVCIQRLYDAGVRVVSLTCDGPSCHISMLRELGASPDVSNLIPSFPHPSDSTIQVHIFLDVCHMLKLVRNTLGDQGMMIDDEGKWILWKYIVALQELQDREGLRLANKLKLQHIHWRQQKMKVKLAAQAISSSVADAIEFCNKELKLEQFAGSEATVRFLRIFDRLFDTLNSRSCQGKGYKAPLSQNNKQFWDPFLRDTSSYIRSLKNASGVPLYETGRKTAFLGFLMCIESTKSIFCMLVEKERLLRFLLMYKFSQDHLELFFAAIRAAGGFNNNPTTIQFIAAYKRLFVRSAIAGTNGNCEQRDGTQILNFDQTSYNKKKVTLTEVSLMRMYDLEGLPSAGVEEKENKEDYFDDCFEMDSGGLSEYKQACVSYIAGFAGKMAKSKLVCSICIQALGSQTHQHETTFLAFKDRGGLFKPSESVVFICEETERCFQRMLLSTDGNLPRCSGLADAIPSAVFRAVKISSLFTELDEHMKECSFDDNHVFNLIKLVAKCYSKVRFHHLASEENRKIHGTNIRRRLSKLILFKNQ